MKNRFFNQGLLAESYGILNLIIFHSAISFNRPIIGYMYIRCSNSLSFIKHHLSLNSLECLICALHVIRLSENASTALPATSVTDGSIAYVIQVKIYLIINYS